VADVRILGAIGIIEMVNDIEVEKTQNQLIDNGVWLRPYGKFLYTMPPFIITDNELSIITNAIKTIINK
jgi:adenosylmethionine-8-amino-7-oxononanoate aminotransferase